MFIIGWHYETPIYFSNIYCYIVYVLWEVSDEVYISLVKFELDIHGRKAVHLNEFFYSCMSNHFVCISRIAWCSLDRVLGIGYSILCIILQDQCHFFNSIKEESGTFRFG